MTFELLKLTAATLVSLTSRTERNGEDAIAKTPAQIRGAKAAATRRARAAA